MKPSTHKPTPPYSNGQWLAVDLDGTLTPCDTLWECIAEIAQSNPLKLPVLLLSLIGGKAKFKRELAKESP